MSSTDPTGRADPRTVHPLVVECFESFSAVLDMVRPVPSNPSGDPGPDAARARLDRLAASLAPFSRRRLDPDPFVGRAGLITLPVRDDEIHGSSLHDAVLKMAGRGYDALRVVETREYADAVTGERRRATVYADGPDLGDGVVCAGPFVHRHYSELPWSAELWDDLVQVVCDQNARYFGGLPAFRVLDKLLPSLAIELQCAIRNAPAGPVPANPPTGPVIPDDSATRGKTKGKNVEGRMWKVASTTPESLDWDSEEWALHLGNCTSAAVRATNTWKKGLVLLRAAKLLTPEVLKKLREQAGVHAA